MRTATVSKFSKFLPQAVCKTRFTFEYLPALVDVVFPRHRVHLLGGVSDAGKTRLILPAMLDFERGLPIFNHASRPVPWAYVSGDRSLQEAEETVHLLGIESEHVRIIPAFGAHNKNFGQIISAAAELNPQPEFLVIEGFGDLPDGDKRNQVREFLSSVNAYCQPCSQFRAGLTVLGIVESPKLKPNERYANPRQRISGVSAWGYHSSTVILIEHVADDDAYESDQRQIWICPKGSKREKLIAQFDARGCLRVRK